MTVVTGITPLVVREHRDPFEVATVRNPDPLLYGIRIVAAVEVTDTDAYRVWTDLLEERGFRFTSRHDGTTVIVITGDGISDTDYVALRAELGPGAA